MISVPKMFIFDLIFLQQLSYKLKSGLAEMFKTVLNQQSNKKWSTTFTWKEVVTSQYLPFYMISPSAP